MQSIEIEQLDTKIKEYQNRISELEYQNGYLIQELEQIVATGTEVKGLESIIEKNRMDSQNKENKIFIQNKQIESYELQIEQLQQKIAKIEGKSNGININNVYINKEIVVGNKEKEKDKQ